VIQSKLAHGWAADVLLRRNPLLYGRYRRFLKAMEGASLAERRAVVEGRLALQKAQAKGLRGYRSYDFDRPFADLPVLTKERLRNDPAAFRAARWQPAVGAVTSGSSGHPLKLARSWASIVFEQAVLDSVVAQAGIELAGARVAVLRGEQFKDPNDREPPYWRQTAPRRLTFSSNHLRPASYVHFRDALRAFRPDVLMAYPSSIELLTDLAENDAQAPRIPLVMCSSETPRLGIRARVQRVFGAALLEYYGLAERVSFAYALADREYRFLPAYSHTELVPDGRGRCRIVGTSLWNQMQLLMRYDTGDYAELPPDTDAAAIERIALGLDPFPGIDGRVTDFLQRRDGSRVYAMHHVPLRVEGVATIQFVQEDFDQVLAVVVPSTRFSDRTLDEIRANFYREAPAEIALRFEIGSEPRRLSNGKAPLVLRPTAA
jgi:phenylacetate-CoA ligase